VSRPTGITVLSILAALAGTFALVGSIALFVVGTVAGGGVGGAVVASGIAALAFAVLSLVVAYGLWDLRPWAPWACVVAQLVGVLRAALAFAADGASLPITLAILAAHAAAIWYISRADIREAFADVP
jgi:hypothetical protein